MGETTGISWTDHTFNPWQGCTRVSEACRNCYAERTDNRFVTDTRPSHWGPTAPRKLQGDKYWAQPEAWNRKAIRDGVRRRVFCASMADVFEAREDLHAPRARLWQLIHDTPGLDWLLLTKRPENMATMLPWVVAPAHGRTLGIDEHILEAHAKPWPNVWLGVTAEDNARALERVPILRATPAVVRFISCEPILEDVTPATWTQVLQPEYINADSGKIVPADPANGVRVTGVRSAIHWLIVGDESGPNQRPAQPDWIRTAREAAQRCGVAFHFKQWAGRDVGGITGRVEKGRKIHLPYLDGKRHAEFPK